MTAVVLRADARELPLPDASVDLIVTSPPYFGLRSYTDGGKHYPGQIGSEATPAEWLQAMLACTREWMRVLKPGGSIFVNLGDSYSGKANAGASVGMTSRADRAEVIPQRRNTTATAPYKSLLLMPERYRIACIDELGLTVRAVMIWDKPNGLPESVKDRVRRSHEDWVHLTLGPTYFSSIDAIREQHRGAGLGDVARGLGYVRATEGDTSGGDRTNGTRNYARATHALGRLPGSVWEIPSEPLYLPVHLGIDHFAAFPTEWPRRLILGWSPSGICCVCSEPRRPAVATAQEPYRGVTTTGRTKRQDTRAHQGGWNGVGYAYTSKVSRIVGETCACTPYTDHPGTGERHRNSTASGGNGGKNVGTRLGELGVAARVGQCREYHLDGWTPPAARPAVVLDPFGGTGTTALVAYALGRMGISVDRSADYCRIARWRTSNPAQLAKAMRVETPPTEVAGQGDMLALLDGQVPS